MINKKKKLNSRELLDYQPNRYPFLMIDYVTLVVPGKLANGYKYFTNNEWFFPIHFPGHPNVPGALQLEAMAQMLTVAITTLPGNKGIESRFYTCAVKYKREIVPGEKLVLLLRFIGFAFRRFFVYFFAGLTRIFLTFPLSIKWPLFKINTFCAMYLTMFKS